MTFKWPLNLGLWVVEAPSLTTCLIHSSRHNEWLQSFVWLVIIYPCPCPLSYMIHEVRNYVGLAQSKNEIAIVGNPSIHTQKCWGHRHGLWHECDMWPWASVLVLSLWSSLCAVKPCTGPSEAAAESGDLRSGLGSATDWLGEIGLLTLSLWASFSSSVQGVGTVCLMGDLSRFLEVVGVESGPVDRDWHILGVMGGESRVCQIKSNQPSQSLVDGAHFKRAKTKHPHSPDLTEFPFRNELLGSSERPWALNLRLFSYSISVHYANWL